MTRSNGRLANDAWEALLTAHAVVLKELQADEIWDEISLREYDVLYTLARCDTALRLSELNRHVLLSQPALSRLVERLIERGLVQRFPDPDDARCTLLRLTESGRALQRRIGRRHAATVTRVLTRQLDHADLGDLARLCTALASPDPGRAHTTVPHPT